MNEPSSDAERRWYVLHYIRNLGKPSPRQHIDNFNKDGHSVELFAPIIRPAEVVNGKVVYKEKLLTYYYVFVRGSLDEVKALCAIPNNNLSLMLNHGGSERYVTIGDAEMERFKFVANLYINSIPFFNIEDIELEEGDKVEVVDGEYAGLSGVFIPKPKSNKGNLVIAANASYGTMVWNIDAKYIRILEFSKNTRRQYDIIDSFIPKLYPILRKYFAETELTAKEKTQLAIFNSRMCKASVVNHKLEAKLLATLMCVQTLLGDENAYKQSLKRFEKRKDSVTNPWTLALIHLMSAVSRKNITSLTEVYESIQNSAPKLTASQSRLLEEYQFYLGL